MEFEYVTRIEAEIENITTQIKNYFALNGPNSKAVIGISGGKDSTIAAALLVRALGTENVVGVLMPEGEQKDIDDSRRVCEILGITNYCINIKKSCDALYHELLTNGQDLNDRITTNTPSRIRMATLYMVAAVVGGRVINTCNYSEDYVGYSTKYGDLAGDFSILKEYTVREILNIGDFLDELPSDLVHKVPVDGMCDKTDEDNLGFTYEELDEYLIYGTVPRYDAYKNIWRRHECNLHKECVDIPCVRKTKDFGRNLPKENEYWEERW